nr:MAG TPA_asm: hypothetical protein [Caudoviricetes sp.]
MARFLFHPDNLPTNQHKAIRVSPVALGAHRRPLSSRAVSFECLSLFGKL